MMKDALEKGAEPVVGGGLEHKMGPNFFPPTLLVGCTLDMRVSQEEIFGPLAGVMKFVDADEALAISNRRVTSAKITSLPPLSLGVCVERGPVFHLLKA